ncbi:MAG: ABC transporter substrate-binding protein, partial [Nitrospirota bacterium]
MRRMQWILIAMLLLGATPVPAADKTLGVIMSGNIGYYQEIHKAFEAALVKEGFDHRTVDTFLQMPSPDPMSWTNAARRLAVAEVNVLVTYGEPAALAAIRDTKGIPIVFAGVYDPNAVGVSAKNVTGISSAVPIASLLKYAKKITPFTRLAVVYSDQEPDSVRQANELTRLEGQYGFQTVKMPVKRAEDARKLVFTGKADAVFISVSAVVNEAIDVIVKTAHDAKVLTISQTGGTAEHGVILSLAPSAAEQGEAAAQIAARMLRGENPKGIPVEFPKRVELVL